MSGWTADQEIEQAITAHLTTVVGPISAKQLVAGFRAKVRRELQADVLASVERRLFHPEVKAHQRAGGGR